MGFLAFLPGLFTLLDRVLGPLFSSVTKSSVLTSVLSGGGLAGVLAAIEGSVGKLENAQIEQIKAGIAELEAQTSVIKSDTESKSLFSSWHAMFCWGMSIITLSHFAVAEVFNIMIALGFGDYVGRLAPMDTATLAFIGGVLGLTMAGKTVERVNANTDDN